MAMKGDGDNGDKDDSEGDKDDDSGEEENVEDS